MKLKYTDTNFWMHTKNLPLRGIPLFSKTEMMTTSLENMMQSAPHKLPARTPSTKNNKEKRVCSNCGNKYKSTDYKRWLPRGCPNCSSRQNKMFLLESLKKSLERQTEYQCTNWLDNPKYCIWAHSTQPNEEHQLPLTHQATREVWCFEESLHIFSWWKVYKENVSP